MYGYVHDISLWIDPFGLECSNFNGRRGESLAEYDLERNGFTIVDRQVPMTVNGSDIRADILATRNGKYYVIESKMNSGRLTPNQKSSQMFSNKKKDMANSSITGGGTIKESKGKKGTFIVSTRATTYFIS
ncbi:nuclease-related domain-containing protein [Myroides albus]|uniref:nuclease-related domain-containing protein n=1 Tax=Myroides albus TaxID=2562892 RepID=UPI001E577511